MTTKQLAAKKATTQIVETDGVILSNIKEDFNKNTKTFKFEVFQNYESPGIIKDVTRSAVDVLSNTLSSLAEYWPESIFTIDYNSLQQNLRQDSYVVAHTSRKVGWSLSLDGFMSIVKEAIDRESKPEFPKHIQNLLIPVPQDMSVEQQTSDAYYGEFTVFSSSEKPDGCVFVTNEVINGPQPLRYGWKINVSHIANGWSCPYTNPVVIIKTTLFNDALDMIYDTPENRKRIFSKTPGGAMRPYFLDRRNIPKPSNAFESVWNMINNINSPSSEAIDVINNNWYIFNNYQRIMIWLGLFRIELFSDSMFSIPDGDYVGNNLRNFIFIKGRRSGWKFVLNEDKQPVFSFYNGDTELWSNTNLKFSTQRKAVVPDVSSIDHFDDETEIEDDINFFNHLDKKAFLDDLSQSAQELLHSEHDTLSEVILSFENDNSLQWLTFLSDDHKFAVQQIRKHGPDLIDAVMSRDMIRIQERYPDVLDKVDAIRDNKDMAVIYVQTENRLFDALGSEGISHYASAIRKLLEKNVNIKMLLDYRAFIDTCGSKLVDVIKKVMEFTQGEIFIPKFTFDDLEVIKSYSYLDSFNRLLSLHRIFDFAQSKAVNNVIALFEEFSENWKKYSDISISNVRDIQSVKNQLRDMIANYETSFDSISDDKELSEYEKIVADMRDDGRPSFNDSFDDLMLSFKVYVMELRAWLYRKIADSKVIQDFINKLSSMINKIKISIDFPDMSSVLSFIGEIALTGLTKTATAVSNGLAVIDDIADFIGKSRLAVSVNKDILPLKTYTSGRVVSLGKDNITLIFDGVGQHSKVFVPNFSGKSFGDKFWYINNDLPVFTQSKLFINPKACRNVNPSGSDYIHGWIFDLDPTYFDEYKPYMKNLSKIAKKFPYLAYASFFLNKDVKFSPNFTTKELEVMWGIVSLQAGFSGTMAAVKSPGVITRLVAGAIAMAAVYANNGVALIRWQDQFEGSAPELFRDTRLIPTEADDIVSMPFSTMLFQPWSKLKWVLESSKFALGLSAAFASAVAVGNVIGSAAKTIRSKIRRRKVKKAYFKPVREEKCIVNKKGKTVCKMVKVTNPQRFTVLPNGEKVKLTRSEVYDKIAFDTFIEARSSKASKLSKVMDAVKITGENLSSPAVAAAATQSSIDAIKMIFDKTEKLHRNVTILNKSLGLKHDD